MTTRGPAWSTSGLDVVGGRYPLRVERHLSRLVDSLLPGVITTTPHARSYALHTAAWGEAKKRHLEMPAAVELIRRAEVVLAGITVEHHPHESWIPEPHGGGIVGPSLTKKGHLDVDDLAAPKRYSQNAWGFAGVYFGSELRLGLLTNERPPGLGPRADADLLGDVFADLVALAARKAIDPSELAAHSHLCACAAPENPDGEWLRQIFVAYPDDDGELAAADLARRQTAQLLGRVVGNRCELPPQDAFRRAIAFGEFLSGDPVASSLAIAQAWRGAIIRNYSVGAWRRLWSWVVDLLGEPEPVSRLAEQFADALPSMSVGQMLDGLPERISGGVLLPAEEQLRSANWAPDPLTEIQLLALGTQRLDDLEERALQAFAGAEREDDLGPRWFRAQLEARRDDDLRDFGRWLVGMMVGRAQRVALTKMEFNRSSGKFWIPSRIRERGGLIARLSREGWFDVGLRVDTFSSVLSGCGVLERDEDGICSVTDAGAAVLA